MAPPSGAPYGNHDCRNGIAAQTTERGAWERKASSGQGPSSPSPCASYGGVFRGQPFTGRSNCAWTGLGALLPAAEGFLCSLMLAARGLYTESMKVCRSLEEGRIQRGQI